MHRVHAHACDRCRAHACTHGRNHAVACVPARVLVQGLRTFCFTHIYTLVHTQRMSVISDKFVFDRRVTLQIKEKIFSWSGDDMSIKVGHSYIGHSYIGHAYTDHEYAGHNHKYHDCIRSSHEVAPI